MSHSAHVHPSVSPSSVIHIRFPTQALFCLPSCPPARALHLTLQIPSFSLSSHPSALHPMASCPPALAPHQLQSCHNILIYTSDGVFLAPQKIPPAKLLKPFNTTSDCYRHWTSKNNCISYQLQIEQTLLNHFLIIKIRPDVHYEIINSPISEITDTRPKAKS